MESIPSAASSVLPDVSQIQLSRRRPAGVTVTTEGRPASAQPIYGCRAVASSPVDAVLRHFRAVRQKEQELHQQRQAALQRFSLCSPDTGVQHHMRQQQSQHIRTAMLQRNRPMSAKLTRDSSLKSACSTKQQAVPAGSQSLMQGQPCLQHWEPPASSLACNSFRHSLPPHSQRPATSHGHRPGTACLSVSAAQPRNEIAQGRQSSFGRRAAYGDVLRRVRTAAAV